MATRSTAATFFLMAIIGLLLVSPLTSVEATPSDAPLPLRLPLTGLPPEASNALLPSLVSAAQPVVTVPVPFVAAEAAAPLDSAIVRFQVGTNAEVQDSALRAMGVTLIRAIPALNASIVRLPAGTSLESLPRLPLVSSIEADQPVSAQQTITLNDPQAGDQWAIPALSASALWSELPANPRQVLVAVIDSGICANLPDLQDRVLPGRDFVDDDNDPADDLGHGCAVASLIASHANNGIGIAGIAPNARLLPLRVLDSAGTGRQSDVASAVVYGVDQGAEVILLSLGGTDQTGLLRDALDYALDQGITVIGAAGNTGSDQILFPAAHPGVIAVGSLDSNLGLSTTSARGEGVDQMLPGENLLAAHSDGSIAPVNGTSFAAAYAAGLEALRRAMPTGTINLQLVRPGLTLDAAPEVSAAGTTDQSCALEMMLVLDGSGSIASSDFDQMRAFIRNLTNSFTIGPNATRMGIVQFSDSAGLYLPLSDSASAIINTATNMVQMSGSTNITAGIQLGQGQLAAGRPGAPRVMIVLTDGEHNTGPAPVPAADAARAAGTQIFGVAVGLANLNQITAIAGGSANVVSVSNFSGLASTIQRLVGGACALTIEMVDFEDEEADGPGWRALSPTGSPVVDGNYVRISITVRNNSNQPVTASLRLLDGSASRPPGAADYPDLLHTTNCNLTVAFPPGQKIIQNCIWDSSGFAWTEDARPNLTQRIVVKLSDSQNITEYDRTELDEYSVEMYPKPLFLVHGLWSSGDTWDAYPAFLTTRHPRWDSYAISMDTGTLSQPLRKPNTIAMNAAQLSLYIRTIRQALNARQVDVVAHSMGGLITREYIQSYMPNDQAGLGNRPIIRHLVMLGTPNQGSPCSWIAPVPATWELNPFYLIFDFNKRVRERRMVEFSILAGWGVPDPLLLYFYPALAPVSTCTSLIPPYGGTGDVVVSRSSAFWTIADRESDFLLVHTNMPGSADVFSEFVFPRLAIPPSRGNIYSMSASAQEVESTDELAVAAATAGPQLLVNQTLNLSANQSGSVSIPVNFITELSVNVLSSPAITLTLRDPSNTVRGTIAANSTDAQQWFKGFNIENAAVGTWTLQAVNTSTGTVGVTVTASLANDPLSTALTVTPVSGVPQVQIGLTLTNNGIPVTGGTVTARLMPQAGTASTLLTLLDNGLSGDGAANDGNYGVRSATLAPDVYMLEVSARTPTSVERLVHDTFTVSSADLAVIQTDTPDPVTPGGTLTYTISITNNGPTTASDIILTNTLPAQVTFLNANGATCTKSGQIVTCDVGGLAPNGVAVISLQTQVKTGTSGSITNQAVVSSSSSDPNTANNTHTENTLIANPAANDTFGGATPIGALPATITQDSRLGTTGADDPAFGCGWQVGRTLWYRYTPSANGAVRFSTMGSDFNTVLAVWNGTSLASLSREGCSDDEGGAGTSLFDLAVTAGRTYYIAVGGYDSGSGSLRLSVSTAPAPTNNTFASPITIGALPFTENLVTLAATTAVDDPTPSCDPDRSRSVWYRFISTGQSIEVNTQGSNYDTVLSVWTRSSGGVWTAIGCDDDSGGANTSRLRLRTVSGTTYLIMITGTGSGRDELELNALDISTLVPANDEASAPTTITALPFSSTADTRVTLTNSDDPTVGTCADEVRSTVWYRYTASAAFPLRVSTAGSNFDTVLAIFTGTPGAFTQVGCNNDSGDGFTSAVDIVTTPGTTYFIMAGGAYGASGTLRLSALNLTPVNDDFSSPITISSLPFSDTRSLLAATTATDDPAPTACTYSTLNGTIWYRYTPSGNRVLRLSTAGSSADTVISIWTGARGSLTAVSCNDNAASGDTSSLLSQPFLSGVTYFVQIAMRGTTGGTSILTAEDITPLVSPNDDFGSAQSITTLPFTATINNLVGFPATDDPVPPCWTSARTNSVWFSYRPTQATVLRLVTTGASFDRSISVWTGTRGALTNVACQYAYNTTPTQMDVTFNANTTYFVMIAGGSGESGQARFEAVDMTAFVSANDDFGTATNVTNLPFAADIDNRIGFAATDDPAPPCWSTARTNSVWFSYRPPQATVLRLITRAGDFDRTVSVWTGTRGALTNIACQYAYNTSPTQMDVALNANTTYYIMIAGGSSESGRVRLELQNMTSSVSVNDDFSASTAISSLPFSAAVDNRVGFPAADDPAPPCWSTARTNSVWFSYRPTQAMVLQLITRTADFDRSLSVWTGTRGALTNIACTYAYDTNPLQFDVALNANTTYYIMIAGANSETGQLRFEALSVTGSVSANDDFGAATVISSLPFSAAVDNHVGFPAADDPAPPCWSTARTNSIWFSYRPTQATVLRLITRTVDFDRSLSVWTGARGALTNVACTYAYGTTSLQLDVALNANTTYYIMIAGANSETGQLRFEAMAMNSSIPANDDFGAATVVSTFPFSDSVDNEITLTAADDPAPPCRTAARANSIWYRYVATSVTPITFSAIGSSFDTVLSVWTGTRGALTNIACNDTAVGDDARLTITPTNGTTYFVMISSTGSSGNVMFTATTNTPSAPTNDDFGSAVTITPLPFIRLLDTRSATTATDDPNPSCWSNARTGSLWFTIRPTQATVLALDVQGPNFTTVISVWTGTRGALTSLACSYTSANNNNQMIVPLNANTTYSIMVSGASAAGDVVLRARNLTPQVSTNDDFASARLLTPLPFNENLNNSITFTAADDPNPPCWSGARTGSLWYRISLPQATRVRLSTQGANFTPVLSVWTGTRGALTNMGCDYGSTSTPAELDLSLAPNTTYYVMLSTTGTGGEAVLRVENLTAQVPANDDFANARVITTLPFSESLNNTVTFAAADDPNPSCWSGSRNNSLWYRINLPQPTVLLLETQGASFTPVISVWTGARGALTSVGCDYGSTNVPAQIQLTLAANTTYYIMVSSTSLGGESVLHARSLNTLVPANDNFANAKPITTFPWLDQVDNRAGFMAADDPNPSCWSGARTNSLWYSFTPTARTYVRLSTLGTSFSAVLSAWTGNRGALTSLGCTTSGTLDLWMQPNVPVYIMISGSNVSGDVRFTAEDLTMQVPANDRQSDARLVPWLPFSDSTNTQFTFTDVDPEPSCVYDAGASIWYRFTAPLYMPARFSTAGSSFDTVLSVWAGNPGNLVEVGCSDDSNGMVTSSLDLQTTPGTTYTIMVSGKNQATGQVFFNMTYLGVDTGSISGRVFDSNGTTPLNGAPVRVDGWQTPVCTDASGQYRLYGLEDSQSYTVSAGGDSGPCALFNRQQQWWQSTTNPGAATIVTATTAGVSGINFSLPTVALESDLDLVVSATPTAPSQGDQLTYTFTITNFGPLRARSVMVNALLPAAVIPLDVLLDNTSQGNCDIVGAQASCSLGTMSTGKRSVITLRVRLAVNAPSPLVILVDVTSAETDPVLANNTRHLNVALAAPPLDVPLPLSPASGGTLPTNAISLTWANVPEAIGYEVQFDANDPPAITVYTGAATQVTLSPFTPFGIYHWRVRALGANGRLSEWSLTRTVSIESAPNAAPTLNVVSVAPLQLSWSRVDWAQNYRVEVDDDPAFGSPAFTADLPADRLSVPTSALASGVYYWRIRAQDVSGGWGEWSTIASFVVIIP